MDKDNMEVIGTLYLEIRQQRIRLELAEQALKTAGELLFIQPAPWFSRKARRLRVELEYLLERWRTPE